MPEYMHKPKSGYGHTKTKKTSTGGKPSSVTKAAEGMKLNGAPVGQRKTYRITGKINNPY